jgi:hypothetical protein
MEMVEGMLAEPWHLRGYQETRLREFLELLKLIEVRCCASSAEGNFQSSKAEPSTSAHAMQASASAK